MYQQMIMVQGTKKVGNSRFSGYREAIFASVRPDESGVFPTTCGLRTTVFFVAERVGDWVDLMLAARVRLCPLAARGLGICLTFLMAASEKATAKMAQSRSLLVQDNEKFDPF